MSLKSQNEEGMRGTVVWVCEKGHPDLLHKYEGNFLGLCFSCRDGSTCEPRFTPGRRSKAQREKDKEIGESYPRFEEERLRHRQRQKVAAPAVPSEVKVTGSDGATELVEAERFTPEAVLPPFTLTEEQRRQILSPDLASPEITFPRERPADLAADALWPPATPGDVIPVSKRVLIVVLGTHSRIDAYVLKYEIRDGRDPRSSPIKAFKPLDPKVAPTTMVEQFRGEPEPEQIPRSEATTLATRVHRAELENLKRKRDGLGQQLKELAGAPRDVRFHLNKTVEALNRRIDYLERELPSA